MKFILSSFHSLLGGRDKVCVGIKLPCYVCLVGIDGVLTYGMIENM